MDNFGNPYSVSSDAHVAGLADKAERAAFIQRTYAHLGAAVIAFVAIEGMLLTMFPAERILAALAPLISGWGWLVGLGALLQPLAFPDF